MVDTITSTYRSSKEDEHEVMIDASDHVSILPTNRGNYDSFTITFLLSGYYELIMSYKFRNYYLHEFAADPQSTVILDWRYNSSQHPLHDCHLDFQLMDPLEGKMSLSLEGGRRIWINPSGSNYLRYSINRPQHDHYSSGNTIVRDPLVPGDCISVGFDHLPKYMKYTCELIVIPTDDSDASTILPLSYFPDIPLVRSCLEYDSIPYNMEIDYDYHISCLFHIQSTPDYSQETLESLQDDKTGILWHPYDFSVHNITITHRSETYNEHLTSLIEDPSIDFDVEGLVVGGLNNPSRFSTLNVTAILPEYSSEHTTLSITVKNIRDDGENPHSFSDYELFDCIFYIYDVGGYVLEPLDRFISYYDHNTRLEIQITADDVATSEIHSMQLGCSVYRTQIARSSIRLQVSLRSGGPLSQDGQGLLSWLSRQMHPYTHKTLQDDFNTINWVGTIQNGRYIQVKSMMINDNPLLIDINALSMTATLLDVRPQLTFSLHLAPEAQGRTVIYQSDRLLLRYSQINHLECHGQVTTSLLSIGGVVEPRLFSCFPADDMNENGSSVNLLECPMFSSDDDLPQIGLGTYDIRLTCNGDASVEMISPPFLSIILHDVDEQSILHFYSGGLRPDVEPVEEISIDFKIHHIECQWAQLDKSSDTVRDCLFDQTAVVCPDTFACGTTCTFEMRCFASDGGGIPITDCSQYPHLFGRLSRPITSLCPQCSKPNQYWGPKCDQAPIVESVYLATINDMSIHEIISTFGDPQAQHYTLSSLYSHQFHITWQYDGNPFTEMSIFLSSASLAPLTSILLDTVAATDQHYTFQLSALTRLVNMSTPLSDIHLFLGVGGSTGDMIPVFPYNTVNPESIVTINIHPRCAVGFPSREYDWQSPADTLTHHCGAHGTCNVTSGICACDSPYTGAVCDKKLNPCELLQCITANTFYNSSTDQGECKSINTSNSNTDNDDGETGLECNCRTDEFYGEKCQHQRICEHNQCLNGRLLSSKNRVDDCKCHCNNPNITGASCNQCRLQCRNGGAANAQCTTCSCPSGFIGALCQFPVWYHSYTLRNLPQHLVHMILDTSSSVETKQGLALLQETLIKLLLDDYSRAIRNMFILVDYEDVDENGDANNGSSANRIAVRVELSQFQIVIPPTNPNAPYVYIQLMLYPADMTDDMLAYLQKNGVDLDWGTITNNLDFFKQFLEREGVDMTDDDIQPVIEEPVCFFTHCDQHPEESSSSNTSNSLLSSFESIVTTTICLLSFFIYRVVV